MHSLRVTNAGRWTVLFITPQQRTKGRGGPRKGGGEWVGSFAAKNFLAEQSDLSSQHSASRECGTTFEQAPAGASSVTEVQSYFRMQPSTRSFQNGDEEKASHLSNECDETHSIGHAFGRYCPNTHLRTFSVSLRRTSSLSYSVSRPYLYNQENLRLRQTFFSDHHFVNLRCTFFVFVRSRSLSAFCFIRMLTCSSE